MMPSPVFSLEEVRLPAHDELTISLVLRPIVQIWMLFLFLEHGQAGPLTLGAGNRNRKSPAVSISRYTRPHREA